jgi:hypothetical protein
MTNDTIQREWNFRPRRSSLPIEILGSDEDWDQPPPDYQDHEQLQEDAMNLEAENFVWTPELEQILLKNAIYVFQNLPKFERDQLGRKRRISKWGELVAAYSERLGIRFTKNQLDGHLRKVRDDGVRTVRCGFGFQLFFILCSIYLSIMTMRKLLIC